MSGRLGGRFQGSGKPGEKHFSPVPLLFAPHDKYSFGRFINRLLKCHLFRSVSGSLQRTAGSQADQGQEVPWPELAI